MAADWLKPRPLPEDLEHVREQVGSPLALRAAVLAFVWAFAAGTAVPGLEAPSFVVGAAAALIGILLFVLALRGLGSERRAAAVNDWLLYRPEPGASPAELAVFGLLGIGLGVTIVAAVARIAGG